MLLALLRESDGDTTTQIDVNSLAKKYAVEIMKPFWMRNLKADWIQCNWAHFPEDSTGRAETVVINLLGVKQAELLPEDLLPSLADREVTSGPNDVVLYPVRQSDFGAHDSAEAEIVPKKTTQIPPMLPSGQAYLTDGDGSFLTTADGSYITTQLEKGQGLDYSNSISTANWSGISEKLQAKPEVISQIIAHIYEIDALVEKAELTNAESQKAKAITESLRLLVASPEPEWKAIATLLTSPTLTAILNVAAVIQIVLKLFGIG